MPLEDVTAAIMERRAQPGRSLTRAEDVYADRRLIGSDVPLAEWAFKSHPPVFVDREPPDLSRRGKTDAGSVTYARVEQGQWIADCPFCPSAQVVSPLDPRFLCAGSDGCANGAVRGAFAKVVFPSETRMREIELVLLARPERENRNWLGETTRQLKAENDRHLGPGWEAA